MLNTMMTMRWVGLAAAFLTFPLGVKASCGNFGDPAFDQAVARGDYPQAMRLVLQALRANPEEQRHFQVVYGLSLKNDERHGQSDPETQQVQLDPGLFLEGESGACQGVAHELQHLRQFKRDQAHLHTYYKSHTVSDTGWSGCDRETLEKMDAARAEHQAYDCLEDNELYPHAASADIEAVLEQLPFAANHQLRDEDQDYLRDHVKAWVDHTRALEDRSNQSYYLPVIKNEDVRIFCRGMKHLRHVRADTSYDQKAWDFYCRPVRIGFQLEQQFAL